MFTLYVFKQMSLPFPFSCIMFNLCKRALNFLLLLSVKVMTYALLFKINNILQFRITSYMLR